MRFRRDGRHFAAAVKAWFCSLKKNSQIAILVALAHISAILWMSIDYCLSDRPKLRHPVIVRTIQQQTTPVRIAAPQKPQNAALAQAPTAANQPPKAAPPKTKKQIPNAARPSKKNQSAPIKPKTIPTETLQQIEEEFNAIAIEPSNRKTRSAEIKLPSILQSKSALNASIEESSAQASVPSTYHLCLIDLFQSSLQLPELGDVRVKIILSSPGTLDSVQILETKSEKNAEWIRNQLPLLALPSFNDFGIVDAILEFTITFRNVENS